MSLAELKDRVGRPTAGEREELRPYMQARRLIESPGYRARVEQAHREIDAGQHVTLDLLKELIAGNQAARRAL